MRKSMSRIIGISLLSLLIIANTGQKARAQDVEVSFQAFYDNLAPYGQWVSDPEYGNVWVPNEEGNFRPYGSRGHWVMTDYGNTWVSEDPWGWAVYHYGRWTYDGYYGWVWIPGYEWAPAWVSWRSGDEYCGWAPLGPGIGLGFNCPESWWIFIAPQYLYHPDYYHYWRGPEYNRGYMGRTVIINNYYSDNRTHVQYNYGPRREEMERITHQPVQVYRFSETRSAGASHISGQRVSMYRPEVNRRSIEVARPGNSFRATHPLGAPQHANVTNVNRTPAFRQEIQQHNAQPGNRQPGNPQPIRQQDPQRQPQIQPQRQVEPQRQQEPPRQVQPQVQPQRQPEPQKQPVNQQTQPQRQPVNQQTQHPFQAPPRPQVQPQSQPQPQRQPFQQPQPQRQQPMPQQQPQRQQPAPQQQPQRQQPMPQQQPQRQQPMPQQQPQRQQPMPQQQPQRQQPQRQAPQGGREQPQQGGRR